MQDKNLGLSSILFNRSVQGIFYQIVTLALVILAVLYIVDNTASNMVARGLASGFHFLGVESQFDIQMTLIEYSPTSTYFDSFIVGLLNTLLVAGLGIFIATIFGFLIGILRLVPNWLISKLAETYIEILRNIPLLLQIFFWYFAALRALPLPENAINFNDISYLTIKGWYVPKFVWTNFSIFIYSIIFAFILIFFLSKYAQNQRDKYGKQIPTLYISILLIIGLPFLTFLIGGVSLSFEIPELTQLSKTVYVYRGGVSIIPELISLALALSMYTATFIAENVRAGILGVSKGQKEAAASIGLTKGQILKLVVMPQALRIIIPPTTNQYLNLTKNSSLAAAIAYPDIVLVFAGTALMQTGRAIEIISITMLTYLSLSLSISVFMNWYNKKMAIKEK